MSESHVNISIEETNKLRASLGLAPLKVDDDNADNKKKNDFVHKPANNISDDIKRAKESEKEKQTEILSYIDKELKKEKGFNFEQQSKEDFIAEVIKKSKLVAERNKLKEIEKRILNDPLSYTSEDLHGLTIEHKVKNFDTYTPTILTLKDNDILEANEEVLVNINLVEEEKAKKAVRDRNLGFYNDPVDSDEDDDLVKMGMKDRKLLGKYDDEEKHSFKISASGKISLHREMMEKKRLEEMAKGRINLNDTEVRIASDFINEDDILSSMNVKRRAKNLRKAPRIMKLSEKRKEEGEVDEENSSKNIKTEKMEAQNVVDDEDDEWDEPMVASSINFIPNQSTVANEEVRKNLVHLRNLKKEKIDYTLKNFIIEDDEDNKNKSKIKLDKSASKKKDEIDCVNITQEFTSEIKRILQEKTKKNHEDFEKIALEKPSESVPKEITPSPPRSPEVVEEEPIVTSGWQPEETLLSESASSTSKHKHKKSTLSIHKPQSPPKKIKVQDGILGDDINVGRSTFAAALYAQKKGYLEDEKKKQQSIISNPKTAQLLKAQHFFEEKQRYDDPMEMKMTRRERQAGPLIKFEDKREFIPDVKLEYVDEYGQQQDPKEAFRTLSHRFHGKTSGKIKTEKRRFKMEQESNIVSTATEQALNSRDKLYKRMKTDKSYCVTLTGKDKI